LIAFGRKTGQIKDITTELIEMGKDFDPAGRKFAGLYGRSPCVHALNASSTMP
jgi:hypothetical protein